MNLPARPDGIDLQCFQGLISQRKIRAACKEEYIDNLHGEKFNLGTTVSIAQIEPLKLTL